MSSPEGRLELPPLDWRYEMRRECQEVLVGVWVGPAESAKNLERLRQLGITAIVILRTVHEALYLFPRFPEHFRYLVLDVHDKTHQPLISIYGQLQAFLDEQRAAGGNVLIHDEGGMSRAPAMAAMYIIDKRGLKHEQAVALIQCRRYCMHLNAGFTRQLKEFETLCLARAQIAQHNASGEGAADNGGAARKRRDYGDEEHTVSRSKRGREDDTDDMDI